MKKTYKMFLALILGLFSAMNVSAGEIISLEEVPFCTWDGWGADAQSTGDAECAWVVGSPTGLPYGDSNVNNYADLSLFSKLIITVTEGTPRFLLNRDVVEGQWNENEAESHLIDNTRGGWSSKYFSQDGNTYIVDLKLLVKEKGFAHLHAIKGANWADVNVESMEVERQGKAQQVGWTDLINNGNMEGDDVSSFFTKLNIGDNAAKVVNSEITDGVGVDGSRGIMITTGDKTANDYDNQFWFRFNEPVPAGTKYRVSFSYRAEEDATVSSQAHAEPSDYIHYQMLDALNFTPEWQVYNKEGEVTADQSKDDKQLLSVAFNLNPDSHVAANTYYFDNIKFEVYKYGTVAEFLSDIVQIDFGFETNIPELVKAVNKPRLMFPLDCAQVKVNGENAAIMSIEGFADGRFYIFMEEAINDDDNVEVTFTNPTDAAYHLIYTSGPGGDVSNYAGPADYNDEVGVDDAYAYIFVRPTVVDTDPEDGSFNLPNSIKEFKVFFDKNADCARLKATINGKALAISPAEGFAEVVTLVRDGADLTTGEYTIEIDNILAEMPLDDSDFGTYSFTVGIGKVEADPDDQPKAMIPDYFATTNAGGIPEGYIVQFQQETRTSEAGGYGSGPRMFDFADGGDFTKGLYFREGYVEYGSAEGHELALEAGKKYNIHFNTAMWKSNGTKTRFQIFNEADEAVLTQMIDNKPDVNGNTSSAVNGSTSTDIKFIPETSGNYRLKWTSSTSESGDPEWLEIVLANVSMMYVPNAMGIEEIQLLNTALENAKTVRDGNLEDRYSGPAFDALVAAINKYEAEKDGYTAPSAYRNAAAALDAAAQAVKDHRALCDTYDPLPEQAQNIIDANAEKKFVNHPYYAELVAVAAKYVQKVNTTKVDPETGLEYEVEELNVLVIKDDAELNAAIAELKGLVEMTGLLFTEGESKTSDTGVKVLAERLRLGAETLKSLGVAEDDTWVVAAYNTLTDDDELVENIKRRVKEELYGKLKEADNTLFQPVLDENTYEEVTPTYDMTVFVKNPNIYKLSDNMDFTEESISGWTTPEGYNKPGVSCGWGASRGTSKIAEDCMFQTWGASYRVEQTITDLPVGVYTVKFGFGERNNDVEENFVDSYVYAMGSDGLESQGTCPGIGQSFPYANAPIEQTITVTDGILTIGVNGGPSSHTFFSDVRVLLAGAVPGYDYGTAYTEGIDGTVAQPAAVRSVELFDLNGRRLLTAPRGVAVVKKYMSDGTIRTEKVVKK